MSENNITLGSTKNIQRRVFRNKESKGFNVTNVDREFCLTYGELAEAFDAFKTKSETVGEELADATIYLLGIAEMLGIDLGAEVDKKIEINEKREYYRDANGVMKRFNSNENIEALIEHYFPDGLK